MLLKGEVDALELLLELPLETVAGFHMVPLCVQLPSVRMSPRVEAVARQILIRRHRISSGRKITSRAEIASCDLLRLRRHRSPSLLPQRDLESPP